MGATMRVPRMEIPQAGLGGSPTFSSYAKRVQQESQRSRRRLLRFHQRCELNICINTKNRSSEPKHSNDRSFSVVKGSCPKAAPVSPDYTGMVLFSALSIVLSIFSCCA